MATQNGATRFESARHLVDEQFDALKSNVNRVVERVLTEAEEAPEDLRKWLMKSNELVKAHPFVAFGVGIGVGIGIGYGLLRMARGRS
jgi:ElaB/YqjD/DUF883 family membrane-anchored ribosome-binding protein